MTKYIILSFSFLITSALAQIPIPHGYRDFALVMKDLKKLNQAHPTITSLVEYGRSKNNLPLIAIKISDNVTVDENEPEIMITSATHGDEIITVEVVMNLIEELLENYDRDPRLKDIIDGREIYFIPVVNPDGYSKQRRDDHGEDPNRSYPYPGNLNNKPTPSIAKQIQFFDSRNFVGSLDFHAYGELIMYPWSYTRNDVEEAYLKIFDDLSRRMAQTNGYTPGQIPDILYTAKGGSVDYYFMKNKTIAMAVELGRSKAPSAGKIPEYTDDAREATWIFLENFK